MTGLAPQARGARALAVVRKPVMGGRAAWYCASLPTPVVVKDAWMHLTDFFAIDEICADECVETSTPGGPPGVLGVQAVGRSRRGTVGGREMRLRVGSST